MVFSSTTFLFLYLPLVLTLYFALPTRMKNLFLLAVSLFFYYWGETWFTAVMILSILIDYVCGLALAGAFGRNRGRPLETLMPDGPRTRAQKAILAASLVSNLSILAFFKYFHFGIENYNALAASLGLDAAQWEPAFRIALPLGISFFTFQSMSYTIDVYRGHTTATRNIIDFSAFVSLFPQLVAGPIVRYSQIADELRERRVGRADFVEGIRRFIIGLGKKVLIANSAAVGADQIFALPPDQMTAGVAWVGVACYTLQIYYDFSGYSDMAIGLGRMLGFHFPENFLFPYAARSITEFWRRWHVSLSTWFRDYLYVSLGGNRGSAAATYRNLVIVFFLCGLWHGASWSFVVWGLYHGVFLVLERAARGLTGWRVPRLARHVYVMLVTMVSWTIFRAETLEQAGAMLRAMAGFGAADAGIYNTAMFLNSQLILVMALGAVGAAPVIPWLQRVCGEWLKSPAAPAWRRAAAGTAVAAGWLALAAAMTLCAIELSATTHNPFIYFRF